MKVTIFSSNQPRHLNLVKEFAKISSEVFFITEVKTVFPGVIADFFQKSDVMQSYFRNVIASERQIFGDINFLPKNVKTLAIKSGELNLLKEFQLQDALLSDIYIVFGASYIKGWLISFLIENRAINIHMGLSPYYRGSSCNFWAMYDNNPGHVGATIHYLSKGLDSGDILFHCVPKMTRGDSPFDFTMRSVLAAQESLVKAVKGGEMFSLHPVKQNKTKELRYTRNEDFTDGVAKAFLERRINLGTQELVYPDLVQPADW